MLSTNRELRDDLQQVKTQFRTEIAQKDGYLAPGSGNGVFIHSNLVLTAAKLGKYDFSRLKPAAVAVELLDLALRQHFKMGNRSEQSANSSAQGNLDQFSLIRGDHLFARALSLVAGLGDPRVVSVLSQVIADVSEFQLLDGEPVTRLRKMVSLYAASAQIGAMLGEIDQARSDILQSFSLSLGLHCEAGSLQAEKHRMAAKDVLRRLPQSSHRSLLENLLTIQSGHFKEV